MMLRLFSIALMLAIWLAALTMVDERMLPHPLTVLGTMASEAADGRLFYNLGATLARVVAGFGLAMLIGTAIGYAMGRSRATNAIADPWLIVLLNLPALVVIVLAYIWMGLNEAAAVLTVAINKIPNTAVTIREGARTLDRGLDEMAEVFRFSRMTRLRHIVVPQLAAYVAAASRSGLSLTWKIVLVVELIGRPNGVGFEIGTAFQMFDVGRILAYAGAFIIVMLLAEATLVQPLERHAFRWRG
jgi:NitT/TauT family transport system permease protein